MHVTCTLLPFGHASFTEESLLLHKGYHILEIERAEMCCFLLAEEQNKWKTYISHTGWGLGPSMQGVMVTGFEGFSVFRVATFPPTLPY